MNSVILGGGVTGLAAGFRSGLPIYEATAQPGGICSSYYVKPKTRERLSQAPNDGDAYRFEIGGGHWIFGADPLIRLFLQTMVELKSYERRSSVYFPEQREYVAYPLQNHLRSLGPQISSQVLQEITRSNKTPETMREWLCTYFGETLCDLFFYPFHELYTAGLYRRIAPQDAYKSPVDIGRVIQGAFVHSPTAGYNVTFVYPVEGLAGLASRLANDCDIRYGHRAERIDVERREIHFSNGRTVSYDRLVSTLPLNHMLDMTGLDVEIEPDPYTSVLVLNIGAERGPNCPTDQWLYHPKTKAGFHRTGFYSNVDTSFLPSRAQQRNNRVSIYVERSFLGGERLSRETEERYVDAVCRELQDWGFIGEAEVTDPTWIDVAYTWSWPGSRWRKEAMARLEQVGVYPIGRYARWTFQGIADSIRDGFVAGASLAAAG